jgi:hypothetical protein
MAQHFLHNAQISTVIKHVRRTHTFFVQDQSAQCTFIVRVCLVYHAPAGANETTSANSTCDRFAMLAQASRQPKVAPGTKRSRQTFPLGHGSPCAWTWFGASLAARLLWGGCGSGPSLGKSDGRLSWRGLPGRQLQHRHHYPAGSGSHQFMGS